jgi:hypothetical protein
VEIINCQRNLLIGSNVGATYSAVSTGDIISCKVDADGTVKFL